ncbi:hypothetical protein PPSIR1_08471 [Plesiocystis pacifica SIR-1]|uniref:Uncharacterized protein n=1 Tax=Plesiocystis pacifica SIR-1 TaxID=391625 RepID=A6GI46_9BACT|nr:WD40 repeat domain-containing protein [Plesiocystis pacifica]EDM74474.1 hypothetical protein PPSIR1_08471 [Plesiocystis pacifica SIR-1]
MRSAHHTAHLFLARGTFVLLLPALACARPATTVKPTTGLEGGVSPKDPAGPNAVPVEIPDGEVQLIGVHQLAPPAPSEWMFSPGGDRIAAEVGLDCGVWDIPSGSFIERVAEDADDNPCEAWIPGDELFLQTTSRDGALEGELGGRQVEVTQAGTGEVVASFECGGCEEVLDLAFAPDNSKVAVLVSGPPAIEIWDLTSKQRVREEALDVGAEIEESVLGWSDEGVAAVIETQTEQPCTYELGYEYGCDYSGYYDGGGYDESGEQEPEVEMVDVSTLSMFTIPTDAGALGALESDLEAHAAMSLMDEAFPTPGLAHLFVINEESQPRDGTSYWLVDVAPMGHESGLSWGDSDSDWDEEMHIDRNGHWRVDVGTQWVEGTMTTAYDRDDGGWMILSWETFAVHPDPMIYGDTLFEEGTEDPDGFVEVHGVAGGDALVDWEACGLWDSAAEDGCQRSTTLPPSCQPVDYEPASPGLDLMLAICQGQLSLVEAGPHLGDGRGAGQVRHRLAVAPDAEHVWGGEGWLALLDGSGRFVAMDPSSGSIGFERQGVTSWSHVALESDLNLLGLEVNGQLELVDMRSGDTVVKLPASEGMAGLSPDGERIAGVYGDAVKVLSTSDGKELASWPADQFESDFDILDVAWRQDGKALLLGFETPLVAIDASTGEVWREYDIFDWYEPDRHTIDPSWRWIHMDDRSMIRTLDMKRLYYGTEESGWARLDSGEFSGELEAAERDLGLMRYRAVEDTNDIPRLRHEQLAQWLERPGLIEDFFVGEPFPPVHIPESEYRRLVAEDSK